MRDFRVLLISTYDLGRQPFGLASPAAWLRADGHSVDLLDLSRQPLDEAEDLVRGAQLIAFFLPMHTATRLAVRLLPKIRGLSPEAHLCAYGLYAPFNAEFLRGLGVESILGGEFESGLRNLARRLTGEHAAGLPQVEPEISLDRLDFVPPDRAGLPPLDKYARLTLPDGLTRVVGYTEASRGCKHVCRHCPVVPVYNGKFRIVPRAVVLEDIRRQVAAGAQHITFGDPDFFNGPAHATEIVRALHAEFPALSYDATIKVEHLLQHSDLLPVLHDTGCAFVTTAVESIDDRALRLLEKGHTRADFVRVAGQMRALGLFLVPTFVPFTPWTTLASYHELLRTIAELELIENVPPVQLTIRLLIPAGSRLLEIAESSGIRMGAFEPELLVYPWENPDPRGDQLQRELESMVQRESKKGTGRSQIFTQIWKMTQQACGAECAFEMPVLASRATIPYLTEPWYC